MIRSFEHQVLSNDRKTNAVMDLFGQYNLALNGIATMTHRELLNGDPVKRWRSTVTSTLPFSTELSARHMKSVQNMVYQSVSSWQALLAKRVREFITNSNNLSDDRRTVLYRINAWRAWWNKELSLPWVYTKSGDRVPCSSKNEHAVWETVSQDDLSLTRKLVKQASKANRFPRFNHTNTLVLDSIVAKVNPVRKASQRNNVSWWVTVSTLVPRKPVDIPLKRNTYFDRQQGRMCGAVQLTRSPDDELTVSLLLEEDDAPLRENGSTVGFDFGVSSALFATSDGQLFGQKMLHRLRELDILLKNHTAELQRSGVSLKTDRRYLTLRSRISDYVKNEIGRILNRLADRDIRELVVEKLDFRGGGLSKRMNRIVSKSGRATVKKRLESITAKHGVTVTEVPSAYTSQQCSGCDYVHRSNRLSQSRFRCGFCGNKLHADVNAARVIRLRRSQLVPDGSSKLSRRVTRQLLDERHRKRWNLPAEDAVCTVAGSAAGSGNRSG